MSDATCVLSDFDLAGAKVPLRGRSALPVSRPWARLLIVHGYGEHCGRYVHFMQWLAERGVACEAIDLRGHGRSPGRRGFVRRWEEYLDDLQAFLQRGSATTPIGADRGLVSEPGRVGPDFAERSRTGGPEVSLAPPSAPTQHSAPSTQHSPLFVMGHSHGGLITAAAGERGILARARVAACIIASPYLATRVPVSRRKRLLAHAANRIVPWLRVPKGVKPEWLSSDPAMLAEDRADPLLTRVATPRWYLTMRVVQKRVLADAPQFTLPVLCISGAADVVADPRATTEFYNHAGSKDKSLYVYENRAHELIREAGRERVFADILGWMRVRATQPTCAERDERLCPAGL